MTHQINPREVARLLATIGIAFLLSGSPTMAAPTKPAKPTKPAPTKPAKGYFTHLSQDGLKPCPRKRGHRTFRSAVDCVLQRGAGTDSTLVIVCPDGQKIDITNIPEEWPGRR